MDGIPSGRYRHYKGNEYSVLGVARHSETGEELVIYQQEYGDHGLWVRPKQMFLEHVTVAGQEVPRFQPLALMAASARDCGNLLHDLPQHLPREHFQTLFTAGNVRLERIVSHGHASPEGFWYDQEQHEWVVVLQGVARLRIEGEEPWAMRPGDFVTIPAHTRHRVEWTPPGEPTIWLALHYGDPKEAAIADP